MQKEDKKHCTTLMSHAQEQWTCHGSDCYLRDLKTSDSQACTSAKWTHYPW